MDGSYQIKRIIFLFMIFFTIQKSYSQNNQIHDMVSSIEGLTNIEVNKLTTVLEQRFTLFIEKQALDPDILNSVKSIISAGIFEQASFDIIADVAVKAYQSEQNGAPSEQVEDLALIGFSHPLTQDQLEMAAKSIKNMMTNQIEPIVTEEIISYSIYNGWNGNTIYSVCNGIIHGVTEGLEARKLALSFIIGVDQDIDKKDVNFIVNENIQFLKTMAAQPTKETECHEIAYEYLQNMLAYDIPRQIGEEVYLIAISEKWSPEVIKAIFEGLVNGHQMGLTTEKLATAIIVRMAQGLGTVTPQQMVEQEIQYISQQENKKLKLINDDQKKYERKLEPINKNQDAISYPEKTDDKEQPPITYYPTAKRNSLNEQLMWQTIKEFLGPPPTPYQWGGMSRRGIDCSGFTQTVYGVQGIYLPRNSRRQAKVGLLVRDKLKFGDLIFFSNYFNDYITHVGIYVGNNNFAHASCTRGVTVDSLNQKYYRVRFRGAKRIVY